MARLEDVNPNVFVDELAVTLKSLPEIKQPNWAGFVKTGHFKERAPARSDWWYVRAAAVLRAVYRLGPVGTSKLRTKYGGKKNRGVASEHSYKGSGSIIRKVLQQLETAGLVAKASVGLHKGRIVTPKGRSLLNRIARKVNPEPVSVKSVSSETSKDVKDAKVDKKQSGVDAGGRAAQPKQPAKKAKKVKDSTEEVPGKESKEK